VGTNVAYFDIAGQKAKPLLADVAGEKIMIIGSVRYQNFTTKFWIDKPGIKDLSLPESETADVSAFTDIDYVILVGTAKISGAADVIDQGEGYAIAKLVR
jgi:hypothetical protein